MKNIRKSGNSRELGTGGPRVVPIGLDCMGMSWIYAGSGRDDAESVRVIRETFDLGVGPLDTATLRGDGHNRRLAGRAAAGRLDDAAVAMKGGLVVDDLVTRNIHRDGRPEALRRHVEGSLEWLSVERIDLYYLYRVDSDVPLKENWGALAELAAEGKLARIGSPEVTVAQAATAHEIYPATAIQSELSVWIHDPLGGEMLDDAGADAEAGDNLLAWTLADGAAFVPLAPPGRGYLTGTLAPGMFESGDIRSINPRSAAEVLRRNRVIGEEIVHIAKAHGVTSARVSLAWLLGLADNVIPILGTRSGKHLTESLKVASLRLSKAGCECLDRLPQVYGPRY